MRKSLFILIASATLPLVGAGQTAQAQTVGATENGPGDAKLAPIAGEAGRTGPSTDQWVEALRPHSITIAHGVNVSDAGFIAGLFATRSSDNRCAGGCMGAIGYEAIVLNDNGRAGQAQTVYGGYIEATRASGAGTTQGLEIDVANRGEPIGLSPGDMFRFGTTLGLWLGSGAGWATSRDSSAAIGIVANGARWQKGIVFGRDALALRPDHVYEAISLDTRQAISLYGPHDNVAANIYSTDGDGPPIDLEFSATGMTLKEADRPLLSVDRRGVAKTATGLQLSALSFADLPGCTAQTAGTIAFIDDARSDITRWHQQVIAGGGNGKAFLSCNGSGWYAFSF